ncbi:MAG: alpha/beta hydrolase, partial [Thermoleophilia bacterium]
MSGQFVDAPGGTLWVVDEGAGPPILLLHAGIVDHRSWDALVPFLVAGGLRVVRYDARGFGRSTTEDVAFSNRADAVGVLDALGIGRAALVGNSRGGQVAFDVAIESPARVVAVVGVGAGLGGFEGDATPEELALFDEMERLEELDPPDVAAVAEFDVRAWVDGPGQPDGRAPAAVRDAVRRMSLENDLPHRVTGQPIRLEPPAAERLAELRCPVLAVAGALDFSDVAQTARHLEAQVPGARAVVLEGVAHMIGMEAPET